MKRTTNWTTFCDNPSNSSFTWLMKQCSNWQIMHRLKHLYPGGVWPVSQHWPVSVYVKFAHIKTDFFILYMMQKEMLARFMQRSNLSTSTCKFNYLTCWRIFNFFNKVICTTEQLSENLCVVISVKNPQRQKSFLFQLKKVQYQPAIFYQIYRSGSSQDPFRDLGKVWWVTRYLCSFLIHLLSLQCTGYFHLFRPFEKSTKWSNLRGSHTENHWQLCENLSINKKRLHIWQMIQWQFFITLNLLQSLKSSKERQTKMNLIELALKFSLSLYRATSGWAADSIQSIQPARVPPHSNSLKFDHKKFLTNHQWMIYRE